MIDGGHLYWWEITHQGTRLPPSEAVYQAMLRIAKGHEWARDKVGKPLISISGYRPPAVNRAVGGATRSRHLVGDAMDVYVQGMTGKQVAAILRDWDGGLGTYRNKPYTLHMDKGPWRRW